MHCCRAAGLLPGSRLAWSAGVHLLPPQRLRAPGRLPTMPHARMLELALHRPLMPATCSALLLQHALPTPSREQAHALQKSARMQQEHASAARPAAFAASTPDAMADAAWATSAAGSAAFTATRRREKRANQASRCGWRPHEPEAATQAGSGVHPRMAAPGQW